MKFWKEGDRSNGICPECKAMMETIFAPKTIRLEKTKKDVRDVLVAVCSKCDATVAIPPQSTPRLKEVRKQAGKPLEVRLPLHLKDIVLTIVDQLGVSNPNAGVQTFIRYYLRYLSTAPRSIVLKAKLRSEKVPEFSIGIRGSDRISMKLDIEEYEIKTILLKTFGKDVDLVKAMIALGKYQVLDHPTPKRLKELQSIFSIAA